MTPLIPTSFCLTVTVEPPGFIQPTLCGRFIPRLYGAEVELFPLWCLGDSWARVVFGQDPGGIRNAIFLVGQTEATSAVLSGPDQ